MQERAEAIAAAVDLLVSIGKWRQLDAKEDQILVTAKNVMTAGSDRGPALLNAWGFVNKASRVPTPP